MHQPVLYKEIIHALRPTRGGKYVDGTVGAGGHAFGILEASAPSGLLLGFDREQNRGGFVRIGNRANEGYAEMTVIVWGYKVSGSDMNDTEITPLAPIVTLDTYVLLMVSLMPACEFELGNELLVL